MTSSEATTPYSYILPRHRIAQRPVYPPDLAKLLVIKVDPKRNKSEYTLSDAVFSDFPTLIRGDEIFVFNNSKVIPARLYGKVNDSPVEILLLKRDETTEVISSTVAGSERWLVIARPAKLLQLGSVWTSESASSLLKATVLEIRANGERVVEFSVEGDEEVSLLRQKLGTMPIPPYIRNGRADDADLTDYQSCFAKIEGSVAAPTASLHFTENLVARITERGARCLSITLHVGLGSVRDLDKGGGSSEECYVSDTIWEELQAHRLHGGRVVAVGTTVVRALESKACGAITEKDSTNLLIYPGHNFKIVDEVVTNFHQPGTSHLLLVEAFLGRELLAASYDHALSSDYRFLSYGDGMYITRLDY